MKGVFRILDHISIIFHLPQLDEFDGIFKILIGLEICVDRRFQFLAFLHQLLGILRIVPKIGIFGQIIQFKQAFLGNIPVKDASSAEQDPA